MRFEIKNATLYIIIATAAVFVLQLVLGDKFTNMFLLDSSRLLKAPWILVTHIFLHGGPYHLFFNVWGLLMFGPFLEGRIGSKRLLLFYLAAGIAAGIFASFFYSRSLGASGALMGVIGALIILMPGLRLLFFYVIPTPLWLAGIFWALLDTIGVFFPSGIGNIAHLAGMGMGLLYGLHLKKEKKTFEKKFTSKKHLEESDIDEYLKTGRI